MSNSADYYAILGVTPGADEVVIRAAYRALMRKFHPDTNGSTDAMQRAQKINNAFAVLGDPVKRAAYDAARASNKEADRAVPEDVREANAQSGKVEIEEADVQKPSFMMRYWQLPLIVLTAVSAAIYLYVNHDEIWPASDGLIASAKIDKTQCSEKESDILFILNNTNNRAVARWNVDIYAYRTGFSDSIGSSSFGIDQILEPGYEVSYCLRRPGLDHISVQLRGSPYEGIPDNDIHFVVKTSSAEYQQ